MSELDFIAPPTSRAKIRALARTIRHKSLSSQPRFDVLKFLELVLPITAMPGFRLIVLPDNDKELAGAHALTDPDTETVRCSESTYEGASAGRGRDRMTLAHELGHLLMHRGITPQFARTDQKIKSYMSAEWQAKAFGGELLIDHRHLVGTETAEQIAKKFGTSLQAAEVQLNTLRRDGLIKEGPAKRQLC